MEALYELKAKLTPEIYLNRLRESQSLEIRTRSIPSTLMYFILYLAFAFATPVMRHHGGDVLIFGVFLALLSFGRLGLALGWQSFFPARKVLWNRLFHFGFYLTALAWGCFCAYMLVVAGLSWTSFFMLLITCGLAAASVAELIPELALCRLHTIFLLAPTAIAALALLGGLQGIALSGFFTGLMLLLLSHGRLLHREHVKGLEANARFNAMIDALPGTLSWVGSDLKYKGANLKLAKMWNLETGDFAGREVGFREPDSPLVSFVSTLFGSEEKRQSMVTNLDIAGKKRRFFVVGQKYNLGSEAVILGMDISGYRGSQAD